MEDLIDTGSKDEFGFPITIPFESILITAVGEELIDLKELVQYKMGIINKEQIESILKKNIAIKNVKS